MNIHLCTTYSLQRTFSYSNFISYLPIYSSPITALPFLVFYDHILIIQSVAFRKPNLLLCSLRRIIQEHINQSAIFFCSIIATCCAESWGVKGSLKIKISK